MDARQYVEQLRTIKALIENKMEEVRMIRERATSLHGISYDNTKVQTSKNRDAHFVTDVNTYTDMEQEVQQDIKRLMDKQSEILHTIERLPFKEYVILHQLYYWGKKMDCIFFECGRQYSRAHTRRILQKALEHLQEILDAENR